jgi:hypothetical protein
MQGNTDSKTFTIFQTLYLSFYSRPLYQDVMRNRRGLCLPYLLVILACYWVPEAMNIHRHISEFIADEAPQYVDQVPAVVIAGGKASIREPVPFYIRDRKNNTPVAIIDTSGQITSLDKTPALVLLTQDRLIMRQDPHSKDTRSIPLADIGDLTLTPRLIYKWLEAFNNFFIIVLFPFLLLISFVFHIVQAVFLVFFGNSFSKYFDIHADFKSLFRLSVVSFTPAIMLEAVHAILQIDYPYSSFFSFLITSGYLFYAVWCNSGKALIPIGKRI